MAGVCNSSQLSKTQKNATQAGIETLQLEVLSDGSIAEAVVQVERLTNGCLDVLVNNAGVGYSMPVMDLDLAKERKIFELNTFALISTTRAFLPLLRKSTRGSGSLLVNNTSCASQIQGTVGFTGAYNASKAAATSFTEVMRRELEPFGIRVINLMTGVVVSTSDTEPLTISLPPNSIYNVAKERLERPTAVTDVDGMAAAKWAKKVVAQLNKKTPPFWIWEGKWATATRLSNFLPIRGSDFISKPMVGLDVVAVRVKEQEKAARRRAT